MAIRMINALRSKEAQQLLSAGLLFVSTDRQLDNGTIALAGKVEGQSVKYEITSTGAVISNKFHARQVVGDYPLDQYRRGLKAAAELFTKRFA